MSFFEFPHTRTYDSDLGWLIRHVHDLIQEFGSIDLWRHEHETEYQQLYNQVQGLANNLIDVIVPWDPGIEYQIYSIVEYQGDNYIAIQDVPVGVNISDPTYWALANTTVAQINAIAGDVSGIKSELAGRMNPTVTGIYMGDFINYDAYPQSCAMVGDKLYTLSAYDNNANEGLLRVFDLTLNRQDGADQTVVCGHANSLAYCPDNNSFYVCPVWDRSGGSPVPNWQIWKYDASFSTMSVIPAGHSIMSVSYDHAEGKLYCLDYDRNIYEIDTSLDSLTFIENIDYAVQDTTDLYNQDWAIYNGKWYLTDPFNNCISGALGQTWVQSYFISRSDSTYTKMLGELEGWEFNEYGRLIAIFATSLVDDYECGTVVEITSETPDSQGATTRTRKNITLSLTPTTQAQFKNDTWQIKSIRQLPMLNVEYCRVSVQDNPVEPGANLSLIKPFVFNLNAGCNLQCGRLKILGAHFGAYGSGAITPLSGINSVFFGQLGAHITIAGTWKVHNAAAMDLVAGDLLNCDVTLENVITGDSTLTIYGTPQRRGKYVKGQHSPMQILAGIEALSIEAGADYVDHTVTFNYPFVNNPKIVLTVTSTTNNKEGVLIPMVRARSQNDFTMRIWRQIGATGAGPSTFSISWMASE